MSRILFCCIAAGMIFTLSLTAQETPKIDPGKPSEKKDPMAQPKAKGAGNLSPFDAQYQYTPDSEVHEGVPQGKWEKFVWDKSQIYPNTQRDVWVYAPAQYDGKAPACLMIFQDGVRYYVNRDGVQRVPNVLDNLIHRKELPVIVAVFIDPGSANLKGGKGDYKNRSVEYDSLGDKYATFLGKEILPELDKKYNLRKDAAGRCVAGESSGGICAFTVAWERPNLFKLVHTEIGSFTNIRGGHVYPDLVKKSEKKPIRVWLQDGSNDMRKMNDPTRDWFLQNKAMAAALQEKGYDVQAVFGEGTHHGRHAATVMPDAFRWLWRDEVKSK